MKKQSLLFLVFFFFPFYSLFAAPTFVQESGIRISSGNPQSTIGTYPDLQMFFTRGYEVLSATSTDGTTWGVQTGTRVSTGTISSITFSSITACSILPLDVIGYRMLFTAWTTSDTYHMFSAYSIDGLTWVHESGVRLEEDSGTTFIGSPKLLELSNGDWRLFYVMDSNGGNDREDYRVYSSLSDDQGATWSAEVLVWNNPIGEIGISTLTNSSLRLLYTSPDETETSVYSDIGSAITTSLSGTDFTAESGLRFSTNPLTHELHFPLLVQSSVTYKWRMYLNMTDVSDPDSSDIYSTLTDDPDPTLLFPRYVDRTTEAQEFTISGEIFSSSVTVLLKQASQASITGTDITVNSDLSITATFDTQEQNLGWWDLEVINEDGKSGILQRALSISFGDGYVTLVDNLIRPRLGQETLIYITVNDGGGVNSDLYTMNGKWVRNIVDGDLPRGTTLFRWDGKTYKGNTVASGTYLLKTTGPKLESLKKIIVIK